MTSNLVSMDISSDQEVNNNNQEKAGCSSVGIDPSLQVFNRKEAAAADDQSYCSPGPGQVSTCSPTSSNSCSVYSLNDTFRIKVSSAEEWLCVARMPRDFTQTEFESLLDELQSRFTFGPPRGISCGVRILTSCPRRRVTGFFLPLFRREDHEVVR